MSEFDFTPQFSESVESFTAQFEDFVTLYRGVESVWIGDGTTGTNGVLYAKMEDGAVQTLGPVTAYYYAQQQGFTGTFAEWVQIVLDTTVNAQAAASSAAAALASEQAASTSETNAAASETSAAASAEAAATSEENAQDSADAAAAYEESAQTAKTQAQAAQSAASSSASAAQSSAETASAASQSAQSSASSAQASATSANTSAEDSEAYAVGKRDGTDVPSTDVTYHNNSKYYSQQASQSATSAANSADTATSAMNSASISATNASNSATDANSAKLGAQSAATAAETAQTGAEASKRDSEAYAVGTRDGIPVESSDEAYHNNALYYSNLASASEQTAATEASNAGASAQNAAQSATSASNSASSAEQWATGGSGGSPTATNNALYYSQQASNSASDANTSAITANSAKVLAEDARDSAISAKTAAEAAESTATSSMNAAAVSAGQAETASTNAATSETNAASSASSASASAENAEAYAVGKRNGTDVPSTDVAYHNNALYYSQQASSSASSAGTSATNAAASAQAAEAAAASIQAATVAYTYQNSSNGTVPPTGTWTSAPSPVNGLYMWVKIVITWTDSSTSTLYNVSYVGTDGRNEYTHIRYSATNPTADSDMKTTPDDWMGFAVTTSSTAPTSYLDYSWFKIKGETGPKGNTGEKGKDFHISFTFTSVAQMEAYSGTVELYDYAMIDTGSVEDPETGRLYCWESDNAWHYIGDLSGAQGIKGETGDTGNGISSTVLNNDYTLTINYTNGTSYTTTSIRGAQGNKGDNAYAYVRWSATQPTSDSDMKTTPDQWMGFYTGDASTAPTTYTSYTWYKVKGETGPQGGGSVVSKIEFSITTSDWTTVTSGYRATITNQIVDEDTLEQVFYDSSKLNLTSGIEFGKNSSNVLTFTTETMPTGTISGTICVIEATSLAREASF